MTVGRRLAVLERTFGGGRGWDDDLLRREVRRMALEHGVDEDELFAESVKVLQFAQERGLALDSWAFVEAYAKATGEDIGALAAGLEQLRRTRSEEQ